MNYQDHVFMLARAVPIHGVWADLGSGDGAFTLAVRELGGVDVEIYSVERDSERLTKQRTAFKNQFPHSKIRYLEKDFTADLRLPLLDGIVMANSLHFYVDHVEMLQQFRKWLKPGGKFVVVEYNAVRGNPWVPFPMSFDLFVQEAVEAGFPLPKLLAKIHSYFLNEMYSAMVVKK